MSSVAGALSQIEEAQFAENIHAVRLGRDLVLLDSRTDDYLCLPDCGPLHIEGSAVRGPLEALLDLSAAELLCSGSPQQSRPAPPGLPTRSLPAPSNVQPTVQDMAIFASLWTRSASRRPTLGQLARLTSGRMGDRGDLSAIAARVEVFRQLLPFAPWTGACLFQAELLLRFLNAAGLDADWVFGVRTWPFLAHCWLQIEDHCVSQSPQTLTLYRPIMVI